MSEEKNIMEENNQVNEVEINKENSLVNEVEKTVENVTRKEEYEPSLLASFQDIINAMEEALKKPINEIKEEIDNLKKSFLDSYYNLLEEKKTLFQEENNDEEENKTFHFDFPLKKTFDKLYNQYKNLRTEFALQQEKELAKNLEERKNIIAELKKLVDETVDFGKAFKQFGELKNKWNACGNIPKDKYNLVWNDYHFHVERFFDHLHLDREMRDKEFENNYNKKQAIIQRAKDLLSYEDVQKSIRELQILHKIWKEETGPVAKIHRESLWNDFCEISNEVHEKFNQFRNQIAITERENLIKKLEIIVEINNIDTLKATTHDQWQEITDKAEELKNKFIAVGNVPRNEITPTWNALREAIRRINVDKKNFYKNLKQQYQEAIQKREALIAEAIKNKDNENFEDTTPLFIQLQNDWKELSYIPRKQGEKLWKEFRSVCDYYFNRLNEYRKNQISAEMENFNKKKEYLKEIKSTTFTGNHVEDLDSIKKIIAHWKTLGSVPAQRRHIEAKFNRILDGFFNNLNLSRRENELHKFNNRIAQLIEQKDVNQLNKESKYIYRKIEEIEKDNITIENNSMYIQNSDKENALLKECQKKITKNNEELSIWKEKLEILKSHL